MKRYEREVKTTLEIKKSLVTAIKPGVRLDASGLLNHSKEMNQRIEKNIADKKRELKWEQKKPKKSRYKLSPGSIPGVFCVNIANKIQV